MARFSGLVGYGHTVKIERGIDEFVITEQQYFGDEEANAIKSDNSDSIIPNLTLGHTISILADQYALGNAQAMRYIVLLGVRWTIIDVKVKGRRVVLRTGEVYDGPTPEV